MPFRPQGGSTLLQTGTFPSCSNASFALAKVQKNKADSKRISLVELAKMHLAIHYFSPRDSLRFVVHFITFRLAIRYVSISNNHFQHGITSMVPCLSVSVRSSS